MSSKAALKLKPRLAAAASYVRRGLTAADIGTDHCYLPIYLLENGISRRVTATDINEGPLEKAQRSLRGRGLEDRLLLRRADGLEGIQAFSPDDILICGMGGELIRDIIAASDYARSENVRLILQPMTKSPLLRLWLCENGFFIDDEALADDDKIYEIICAHYDGVKRCYTPAELELGKRNIEKKDAVFVSFLELRTAYVERRFNGLRKAGREAAAEETLLCEMKRIRETI